MPDVDTKDVALIRALEANARASVVSLARKIGLSRSATHDRLTRLEESGIIEGYSVKLRPGGMPRGIRAMLTVKFSANCAHRHLVNLIMRQPGVVTGHCVAGDIDMILNAECETISDLEKLRVRLLDVPGVRHITTHTVLKQHRHR